MSLTNNTMDKKSFPSKDERNQDMFDPYNSHKMQEKNYLL